MRITSMISWLLVAVFLTGCARAVESPAAVTSAKAATAAIAAAPATATTPNGGGVTNDEPTLPVATVAAATTPAPPPTARVSDTPTAPIATSPAPTTTPAATLWSTDPHPLQIEVMREQSYPGSPITVEQTLEPGNNYSRYVVSYRSDGLKVYALMTVPGGTKPATGWPVIVFNHGYIPPAEYRTTERYVAYVDMLARSGYIVFKPDYRGFGSSEGENVVGGGYGTPAYTADVLNAVASLKGYEDADPDRIGMWGHSLGGQLTLRAMVVSKDIKAGVVWGGVVPPYPDIIARWNHVGPARNFPQSAQRWIQDFSSWVQDFSNQYGTFDQNPGFWDTISPNTYLADLSGPIQLHHSTTDEIVPVAWSETLAEELKAVNKQPYELYTYPGDNHNINANFSVAMQRTVAFFDKYVKGQ